MYDESHPYRIESLDYPQKVTVLKSYAWHGGTVFETEHERIHSLPIWDDVIVADKQLLALSLLEETEKSH